MRRILDVSSIFFQSTDNKIQRRKRRRRRKQERLQYATQISLSLSLSLSLSSSRGFHNRTIGRDLNICRIYVANKICARFRSRFPSRRFRRRSPLHYFSFSRILIDNEIHLISFSARRPWSSALAPPRQRSNRDCRECRSLRRRNRLNRQLEFTAEIVALSSERDEANDHEKRKAPRATTTDRILLRSRSDSTAAASPSYIVRVGVFPAHSRGR